jgi:hypothetical protein
MVAVAARRFVSLSGEALLNEAEVVLELDGDSINTVALELTLLLEGLANSLRLSPRTGPGVLISAFSGDLVAKAEVGRAADGTLTFRMGRNQVEYLRAVLLRAYRDQMAEVSHVHIEGELGRTAFDLTVMFASYATPMNPEEAAKLMAD